MEDRLKRVILLNNAHAAAVKGFACIACNSMPHVRAVVVHAEACAAEGDCARGACVFGIDVGLVAQHSPCKGMQ